jgi:hypothetical protein
VNSAHGLDLRPEPEAERLIDRSIVLNERHQNLKSDRPAGGLKMFQLDLWIVVMNGLSVMGQSRREH